MNIYVFGNPDMEADSLPIKLLPRLKKKFPGINFIIIDPNELDLAPESPWLILDTVKGLRKVKILTDEDLKKAKQRVSVHDFDLGTHLLLLKKLNKKIKIRIIGIPMDYSIIVAKKELSDILFKADKI